MAGDGGAGWSQLGVGEGGLYCSSDEGEGTNRGSGFSSSSWGPSIIGTQREIKFEGGLGFCILR
jgi:hypothetical protein